MGENGQTTPMRHAWRLVLILFLAIVVYLMRLESQDFPDPPTRTTTPHAVPTTTCTTFANGQGGGWICGND